MNIINKIMEMIFCLPSGGSFRDENGNRFTITPYGDIGLDLKDEKTKENFYNKMKEHNEKYGPAMNKIIQRNRRRIEEERQAKLKSRCNCKCQH